MPRDFYEICRVANRKLDPEQAARLFQRIGDFHGGGYFDGLKDIELFGGENRLQLFERFEPVHDYLNSLTCLPAFFPDQQEVLHNCETPEYDAARRARQALIEYLAPHESDAGIMQLLLDLNLDRRFRVSR